MPRANGHSFRSPDDGGLTIDESVVPVLARDAQFVAALFEAMVSLNPGLSPDEVLARLTR